SYAAVSGDFFYPKKIDHDSACLFFGDSCGHGLPAALISMRIIGLIQSIPLPANSPLEYLTGISNDIRDVLPQGRYVAGNYTIFNKKGFIVSNGGQPCPVLLSQGTVRRLDITGHPLGIMLKPNFTEIEMDMKPKDKLILYSDGITGIVNEQGDRFGTDRLLKCLQDNNTCSAQLLKDKVAEAINLFTGNTPPSDDMTMIIIEKR
ncbi:PP2C family protein-serine/threonine phosphatase, partial [Desulfobacterales bacterium HSG17]|nr:PP2C family protein-serine/threonine phosphatase [Desulfobacterales bacterium HSG17]